MMISVLVQFDETTLAAIDRIARKGQRATFIRQAVKEAIRKREFEHMREAYLRHPDAASEADDWTNAEEWRD